MDCQRIAQISNPKIAQAVLFAANEPPWCRLRHEYPKLTIG
jgi:hypothetical protein